MSTVVSRSVLSKTVGIFAGITHKNLKLEDAPEPSTDGTVIRVPHDSPDSYELLEKELARVVFHSDALVRQAFVDEYVAKMGVLAQRHNVAIEEANIGYLVGGIFDVLEAYRVLTLWSKIYPGSAGRIEDLQRAAIHQALTAHTAGGAEPSVLNGLLATSHGVPYDLGALENLRPYLAEALQKVERPFRQGHVAREPMARVVAGQPVDSRRPWGCPRRRKAQVPVLGRVRVRRAVAGPVTRRAQGSSGAPEEPPPDPNDQSPPEEDPQGQQDPASPEPQDTNNPGDNKRPPQGSESQDDTDAEGDGDPPGQSEREQPQAPPPPSKQKEPRLSRGTHLRCNRCRAKSSRR
jgi:hypothetical protein